MLIHVIGDSHVNSFKGWNIRRHYLGPITMKRISNEKEPILVNAIKCLWGYKFFCFGEIDVRCHIKNLSKRKSFEEVIQQMVDDYVEKIKSLNIRNLGIISLPPISPMHKAYNPNYPIVGSDDERRVYTQKINRLLKACCMVNKWAYVNAYDKYCLNGYLNPIYSDGTVHIKDSKGLKKLLEDSIDEV